jgi:hypothetical protein
MPTDNDLLPFDSAVEELLNSARLLEEHDFVTPFLIILYCTIDTMAWLALPDDREIVESSDFIAWVNNHSLRSQISPCRAEDLYGARCGLLHSYNPKSSLSRDRKVREIYYLRGFAADRWETQQELNQHTDNGVVLHIGKLFLGVERSVGEFREEITKDPILRTRVVRRSQHFLRSKVPDYYIRHWDAVRGWLGKADGPSGS